MIEANNQYIQELLIQIEKGKDEPRFYKIKAIVAFPCRHHITVTGGIIPEGKKKNGIFLPVII
jgi:hypothetical protein